MLKSVVFPAPLGPMIAVRSPWRTSSDTSRTAVKLPKSFPRRSTRSKGSRVPVPACGGPRSAVAFGSAGLPGGRVNDRPLPFARLGRRGRFIGEIDEHVLHFGVQVERIHSELASQARLFVPTEGGICAVTARAAVRVDADHAAANIACHTECTTDVPCPNGSVQSVFALVRHLHDFLLGVEGDDDHDRSEYFLLGDARVVAQPGDDRRRKVAAGVETGWPVAARDDVAAGGETVIDHGLDVPPLRR